MDFIYGRRPVLEALQGGKRSLHKLWIAEGSHGMEETVRLAREHGVPLEFVRRSRLEQMVSAHHQGVVAQASAAKFLELNDFLRALGPSPAVVVAFDEIQDPHNVGAILRSAGYFGVAGALVPKWRSAPVGETAARVSSGAIEHIPLIRVTNLAESVKELQAADFEVIGADIDGQPIAGHSVSPRTAIIFGSEGKGLRRLVRERCDKLLKIPGSACLPAGRVGVGSLNVSAAAAIFLYEFCRRSSTGRAPVL